MSELRGSTGWIASPDPIVSLYESPAYRELVDAMLGHAIEVTRPIRGGVSYRYGEDARVAEHEAAQPDVLQHRADTRNQTDAAPA